MCVHLCENVRVTLYLTLVPAKPMQVKLDRREKSANRCLGRSVELGTVALWSVAALPCIVIDYVTFGWMLLLLPSLLLLLWFLQL